MVEFSKKDLERLEKERNIWFSSVRSSGKPHMVPLWFVFVSNRFFVCTTGGSVKVRNVEKNNQVVIALEDGFHAFICEGVTSLYYQPFNIDVVDAFIKKYEWNIMENKSYNVVIEIVPLKLLKFNDNR